MNRGPGEALDEASFKRASTWTVLCLAVAFLVLGILFILLPRWGAALFGIPAVEGQARAYVRAIAFGTSPWPSTSLRWPSCPPDAHYASSSA